MTYLNERWELVSRRESRQNLPAALLIALVGLVMFVVGIVLSSVNYTSGAALAFGGLLLFGLFGIIHARTVR
jgi:hypothetical protein